MAASGKRKNISVEKGEKQLFDEVRYFFYITNDWELSPSEVVFQANDRCNQENVAWRRACLAGAGGQSGEQLGLGGDDRSGLEFEGVVGADFSRRRPPAGAAPR
jgi:hypothetical protein